MAYEFQNMLFRTKDEMLLALVTEWLSAGGANSREDMRECLSDMTDDEWATELIESWGLDQPNGDENTWMEKRDVTSFDITATFVRLRQNFDTYFPARAPKLQ